MKPTRCGVAATLASVLCLVSEEAIVGGINYQGVSLEELIGQATLIVLADPDGAPVIEQLSNKLLTPDPQGTSAKTSSYKVKEVLFASEESSTKVNDVMRVISPSENALKSDPQGRRHYLLKEYSSGCALGTGPAILFVSPHVSHGATHVLVAEGGCEAVDKKEKISGLIRKIKSPQSVTKPE